LQSAVQSTNQAISGKGLEFSVDTSTKQTVVKLMDTQSDTVIGQFPSQQMIDISKSIGLMQEQLQQASLSRTPVQASPGLLIKQQA
jgi:flagellar protein FlaG